MESSEDLEKSPVLVTLRRFGRRFSASLGIRLERKEEIYLELSRAATMRDISYWLQIIFSAGIATLGLALNSPAVIIGAMLISPLMGPILAEGLALATGDLILGIRAGVTLLLSSVVAIAFSTFLVWLLPFKDLTGEIASRTQPNTLDLVVALFSGAIGSIAICKEVKGVVTSIPGVAIAVALMPPLCVVGYGMGLAVSLSDSQGLRVATGGGLLFMTNLVAITFTSMLVFLFLRIDIAPVRQKITEWRKTDGESVFLSNQLKRLPFFANLRQIGGFPGRLLMILIPLILILIPLSQSLSQLKGEYVRQQQENRIRRVAMDYWEQQFAKLPTGESRSFIDNLIINPGDGKISLLMRVFTSRGYTETERAEFARLVAARLGRPVNSVDLNLIEVPTTAAMVETRGREERQLPPPQTVVELNASFVQALQNALHGINMPPAVRLITYRAVTAVSSPIEIHLIYLGDREIEPDGQALITQDVRNRLNDSKALVFFDLIQRTVTFEPFRKNQSDLSEENLKKLDIVGGVLRNQPWLAAEIVVSAEENESREMADQRRRKISDYLNSKWEIEPQRLISRQAQEPSRVATVTLSLSQ